MARTVGAAGRASAPVRDPLELAGVTRWLLEGPCEGNQTRLAALLRTSRAQVHYLLAGRRDSGARGGRRVRRPIAGIPAELYRRLRISVASHASPEELTALLDQLLRAMDHRREPTFVVGGAYGDIPLGEDSARQRADEPYKSLGARRAYLRRWVKGESVAGFDPFPAGTLVRIDDVSGAAERATAEGVLVMFYGGRAYGWRRA